MFKSWIQKGIRKDILSLKLGTCDNVTKVVRDCEFNLWVSLGSYQLEIDIGSLSTSAKYFCGHLTP